MAICTKCEEQLPLGAHFCPVCSHKVESNDDPEDIDSIEKPQLAEEENGETDTPGISTRDEDEIVEANPLEAPRLNPKYVRNIAMMCHLSTLIGMFLFIPFANAVAPFVLWKLKRKEDAFIDNHGRECVNFQIPMGFLLLGVNLLMPVLFFLPMGLNLILVAHAAIRANGGRDHRYPFAPQLFKPSGRN